MLNQVTIMIFMLTLVSGAQIGTQQAKVSIIQMESVTITRKTWLTEETKKGQEETIKTIKGSAIISERYVQEAHLLANNLLPPINMEKIHYPKHRRK